VIIERGEKVRTQETVSLWYVCMLMKYNTEVVDGLGFNIYSGRGRWRHLLKGGNLYIFES
jgi:hypothetical protein